MKILAYIQTPYRELPPDFEERYPSVVMAPWWELADPDRVGEYYRSTIECLSYAARCGLDGLVLTEHSQNVYDMVPNPTLIMAALAVLTQRERPALVLLGTSLGKTHQPLRVAEEYAMVDCISGGRLVAGLPVGLCYDANINYGTNPIETRARYQEAFQLVLRAWTATEVFPWNGRFWQFPAVNLWPRPIQRPHPPVWIPGVGTPGTMRWVLEQEYCYCYLSSYWPKAAKAAIDRYWAIAQELGKDLNPYRFAYVVRVVVAETDARAEKEYGPHVEYFFSKCQANIPPDWLGLPGYLDYPALQQAARGAMGGYEGFPQMKEMKFKDFVEGQYIVAGSPSTVRDQLRELVTELRVGNLLVALHVGSMTHELTLKNIDLFSREVAPHLRGIWDAQGWEHRWWPRRLLLQVADGPISGEDS